MSSTGASGTHSAGDGISGGYTGNSLTLRIVIASFTALAWYNALELNILVFVTFHRYNGLYFWSLLVASWGIIPYAMGFLFKFFQITTNDYVSVTLITIGWYLMVTGQSVVLYSRLHLVLQNERILRRILWMIVIDAVILHIPTTILTFGSNGTIRTKSFVHGYNIMEKIQMTGFCIQEFIISGFYLVETVKILKSVNHEQTRKTMYQLFYINVIIIIMDLGLLGVEYANRYILQTSIKGAVYSVKLKLEFAILGKLVQYVTHRSATAEISDANPDFVNTSRTASGIAHAPSKPKQLLKLSTNDTQGRSRDEFEDIERPRPGNKMEVDTEIDGEATMDFPLPILVSDRGQSTVSATEIDIERLMKRYSVKTG